MTRHRSRLRRQLTYANVVATIALVAAIGTGGAYAASELVKNSVGPKQIRKGAVGSRALKNHSIAINDLSPRARVDGARVSRDGELLGGTARRATRDASTNGYKITFKHSITRCTSVATLAPTAIGEPRGGNVTITGGGGPEVDIATYDAAGAPTPASFNLIVAC